MTLQEIDDDLLLCQNHLDSTNTTNSIIETFLVKFLLVRICGEYEKEIENIMSIRIQQANDSKLASFIFSRFEAYKHLKIKDIRQNILARFAPSCLEHFNNSIAGTNIEQWCGSIVSNRDASAHGGIVNLPFDELVKFHTEAKNLFPALKNALNI